MLLLIPVVLSGQWLDGYSNRIKITIPAAQISGASNHIDFPVLVNTIHPDLATTVNGGYVEHSSGYDIVFSEDNVSTLDHQVEKYDAATGDLIAWVRIPLLDPSSDYEFYIYFGNYNITGDQSTSDTWSSDYVSVYHLHDDYEDGTSNVNHGTNSGSTDAAGKIADGQAFNGSQYIDLDNPAEMNFGTNDWTVSAWINTNAG
ncbi:MAG TPA: hypothetical protein DEQ09_04765, partial [Bacteroidales bacterium]|nr:hypothetical protein [Bacteroidales bacterium]